MAIDRGLGGGELLGDDAERRVVTAMREILEYPQREHERPGAGLLLRRALSRARRDSAAQVCTVDVRAFHLYFKYRNAVSPFEMHSWDPGVKRRHRRTRHAFHISK